MPKIGFELPYHRITLTPKVLPFAVCQHCLFLNTIISMYLPRQMEGTCSALIDCGISRRFLKDEHRKG